MTQANAWRAWLAKSLAVVAICLLGIAGIRGAAADTTVRIASPYPVSTLDPSRSAAAGNIEAFGQLYSRLLRRDPATATLEPGLAERWEMSSDGLTLTFFLRDAKFSDGSPLTADDVAFSLERVRSDPQSALPSDLAAIQSITAKDKKTVVVAMKYRFAPILDIMELWSVGIVSKADVERRGADEAFKSTPLASGPYMVKEWRPGEKLVLQPNPHYWRTGFPESKSIVELVEVNDPETAVSMLKSGEVDVIRQAQWSQIDDLKNTDGIEMRLEPANVIDEILLNNSREPFSNLKARQAAAYALDNKAITKAATYDHAVAATTTLPGSLQFHDPNYPGIVPDMAKAKKLLEESGMAGREVKILVSSSASDQQIGLTIQAQWKAIGLNPVLVNVDTAAWWDMTTKGDYDATPTWWMSEITDPDLAVRWALCGKCDSKSFNTFYNNDKVNELIEQGSHESDPAKRAAIYREIAATTTEEVSQIPLYYEPFAVAYSKRISNLALTPAMQWTLEDMVVAE